METTRSLLLGSLLLLASAGGAVAREWVVDQGGQGDFVSIQDGIDAAGDGDLITVHAGTYEERLDLQGKVLDLTGEAGNASTVVDAGGSGSVLLIRFNPAGIPHIRGFTFTNGNGTILRTPPTDGRYGGGVLVDSASPRFEDCVFTGNVANFGGGAFVLSGAPVFVRCRFTGNDAGNGGGFGGMMDATRLEDCDIDGNSGVFGGGVDLFRSRVVIDGCRIRGNVAYEGGGLRAVDREAVPVRIRGSLIAENAADLGGGIQAWEAFLDVHSTTIARNFAVPEGGSVQSRDADLTLESTIVESAEGAPLIACEGGAVALSCVVLWGPILGDPSCRMEDGVLEADPRFCDPATGDYTLSGDSPCLPGRGPEGCGLIGALDQGCDGPVAVARRSWGELKALYR
jgi:hypothetical protein